MLTAIKSSLTILIKSCSDSILGKIFDKEMLIRTLPTHYFHKILHRIFLNLKSIVISIISETRHHFREELLSINGLTLWLLVADLANTKLCKKNKKK